MKNKVIQPENALLAQAKEIVSQLTNEEKAGLLCTHMQAIPRLGIEECYVGTEVARGFVSRDPEMPATVFPEPIGLAATFNINLMEQIGETAANEIRVAHSKNPKVSLMAWGPTVDLGRNPLWGRNEECYGEDPVLAGKLAAGYTKGLTGDDSDYCITIPTLKHFCANNNEAERGISNSDIDPRTAREYYYAAFEEPIKHGNAYAVMTAYNELSGVPCVVNPDIENLLKKQWGLGFVVTDGGDFSQNVLMHKYSDSHAETVALAIKNGVDCFTDDAKLVKAAVLKALQDKLLTEEELDKAATNCILARVKLGEFDKDKKLPINNTEYHYLEPYYQQSNYIAAKQQVVMLKNNGLLPLSPRKVSKLAVVGVNGDVNLMDWYTGYSNYNISILDGLKEKYDTVEYDDGCDLVAIKSFGNGKYLGITGEDGEVSAEFTSITDECIFKKYEYGHGEVTYKNMANGKYFTAETLKADSESTYRWFSQEILKPVQAEGKIMFRTYFDGALCITESGKIASGASHGVTPDKLFTEEIVSCGCERAKTLAEQCEACIVCVGNDPMIVAREMYDRKTLALPQKQSELAASVLEANSNAVLIVVSGYPYSICKEQETYPSILYTTHAGPELGAAIAETICGENNPSGKLPQTWYRSDYDLPDIKKYNIIENDATYMYFKGKPLYPFGHGLSYSTFEYSELEIKDCRNYVQLNCVIRNISKVDGIETAQVYIAKKNSRVKSPIKKLVDFYKIPLAPDGSAVIFADIDKRFFEYYDVISEKSIVESGVYTIMVGSSSEDIRLSQDVEISGSAEPVRRLSSPVKAVNYDERINSDIRYCKTLQKHYMVGGTLIYRNSFISKNATKMHLTAVSLEGESKVTIKADGNIIAEFIIPPGVDINNFQEYKVKLDHIPENNTDCTLTVECSQYCGVMDFKVSGRRVNQIDD